MKKYKCSYENSERQVILEVKVLASSPREAYEKFIEKVGVQDEVVYVWTSFLSSEIFEDHLNKNSDEASSSEKIDDLPKTSGAENANENTEKLLFRLIEIQQYQFTELKKLNFKLMMFWIFLVVLPVLGWLLTQ